MRLKEPFRGLYLVGGRTVFHFALLSVSLIVLGFPTNTNEKNQEFFSAVQYLRIAHGVDVFFAIIQFLGSSPNTYVKHVFTYKVMDSLKMFGYLGAILFAVYHECQITVAALSDEDFWIRHAEVWIRIELVVFFVQILCSSVFLIYMQIKGELG